MSNVGTLIKCVFNGITFDIFADTDITMNLSKYTIEGVATTGRNLMKRTKRVQTVEGLAVAGSVAEMLSLVDQANSLADKTFAITLPDGSVFRATGQINFENYTSMDGKSNVQLIPVGEWTPFLA